MIKSGQFDPEKSVKITYSDLVDANGNEMTELTITSDVFTQYYLKSAAGCKFNGNATECQVLANLCVL